MTLASHWSTHSLQTPLITSTLLTMTIYNTIYMIYHPAYIYTVLVYYLAPNIAHSNTMYQLCTSIDTQLIIVHIYIQYSINPIN